MVNVLPKAIIEQDTLYTEFKGALSEQFVCQELKAQEVDLFYWSTDDARQEIDFLFEDERGMIPVEVKSGRNVTATSFSNFISKYRPVQGYKISKLPYQKHERVVNVPLYNVARIMG
jgi:predicted AAA+ superfamily ATPase